MCGIVAVTGYKKALPLLINGLEKLEYRGYDSAGIAIINSETKNISCNKAEGKLKNLKNNLKNIEISGTVGIGHTVPGISIFFKLFFKFLSFPSALLQDIFFVSEFIIAIPAESYPLYSSFSNPLISNGKAFL